ncbi:hypothetical protein EsDP_00006776 [Epichloe bromicola]|uniref:Uncharacterized protein n=1 Tax=Epichloe bromicola TaxID=79588 RepID=A0ABQ0CYM0_9HYPO
MSTSKPSPVVSHQSKDNHKSRALKKHLKRFWAWHLVAWICITVLVVCITIFVIVPVSAQDKVDDAHLEIQGINALECRPDSLLIQINSTITTDGAVKANLDAFEGNLTLSGVPNAAPFMSLRFPPTSADRFQAINISQVVTIRDKEAFAQYNRLFFRSESLAIDVLGRTNARPAGLAKKYPVEFRKTIELKGLNMLRGTQIKDTGISLRGGSALLNATAIITNPSYYTIEMGNVTFDIFANDHSTGTLDVNNLLLRPGINNIPITSRVNQTQVLQLVKSPQFCEKGIIPFQLRVHEVRANGEEIPWLESAMRGATQSVDINIGEILGRKDTNFCAP